MFFFRNMSIRNKFLTAIVVLFIASLAFSVTVFLAMKDISKMEERVALEGRLLNEVERIEALHLQWNVGVADMLLDSSDKEYKIITDYTACALGSWLNSASYSLALAVSPEIKNIMASIESQHALMHTSAKEIIRLKDDGDKSGAYAVFTTQTQPALKQLQDGLEAIRKSIANTQATDEAAFAQYIHDVTIKVWVFAAFIFVMMAALVLFMLKTLLAPISKISAYSEHCLSNNCAELNLPESNDELGIVARNIKKLVEHLSRELAFSQGVLAGISVPYVIVTADNIISKVNQAMLDYLGFDEPAAKAIGMTSGELTARDKNRETLTAKALRERKALSAAMEYTNLKGAHYNTIASSAPFFDYQGELLGAITIWTDMTEIVAKQQLAEEQQKRMLEVAESSNTIAEEVTSSTTAMAERIEEASRGADVQNDRVHETSTAMNEMNNTIQSVAQNASEASSIAFQAKEMAIEGAQAVEQVMLTVGTATQNAIAVKERMAELGKQTDGIGAIIRVINDIADQTNLLALNAAIEAARAGEAGRGFAVVADEVRKLAEKTMEATKEVGSVVTGIQNGASSSIKQVDITAAQIMEMTDLSQEASARLSQIVSLIEAAAEQVHSIAIAAEEQSATSSQVNKAIEEVSQISSQTSENMHSVEQAILSLSKQASALRELIAQLR